MKGIELIAWISLLCPIANVVKMEKPPMLVTSGSVQERLEHSTVVPDEINNLHFTHRGQV